MLKYIYQSLEVSIYLETLGGSKKVCNIFCYNKFISRDLLAIKISGQDVTRRIENQLSFVSLHQNSSSDVFYNEQSHQDESYYE